MPKPSSYSNIDIAALGFTNLDCSTLRGLKHPKLARRTGLRQRLSPVFQILRIAIYSSQGLNRLTLFAIAEVSRSSSGSRTKKRETESAREANPGNYHDTHALQKAFCVP